MKPKDTISSTQAVAELTEPQRRALGVLMEGGTQVEAAAAAGVTDRAIRLWLKQPEFRGALRTARAEAWMETTSRLHRASAEAVEVLRAAMRCEQARWWERVSAARGVLELTRKAAEIDDLHERITAVEEKLAA